MSVKALVLAVTTPEVAHSQDQWKVLVLYPVRKFGRIYREKRWIFSSDKPALHSWIHVHLLEA